MYVRYLVFKCPENKNLSPVFKLQKLYDREEAKEIKGSAYSELQELIGLDSAKSVIEKAITYSKAQKIFADKGMKESRTAMHMVFTGNPGTAKTTVARLFARILKENGVLSKGDLIECGRSDLVGKYVGWTAVQVKNMFKKAKRLSAFYRRSLFSLR